MPRLALLLHAFLSGVLRLPFLFYRLWCAIGLLVLFLLICGFLAGPVLLVERFGLWVLLFYAVPLFWGLQGRPSPFASFMAWIGTLKVFFRPLCVIEDPGAYKIKGKDSRAILAALRPGDILLRGYDGYVDGFFIRRLSGTGGKVGTFTHAALYVGLLTEAERKLAATDLRIQDTVGNWVQAPETLKEIARQNLFDTGEQMVIHSMGQGIHAEDILTFCRCDQLAILRLPEVIQAGTVGREFFTLQEGTDEYALQQRLLATKDEISREEVVTSAIKSALSKIGSAYDFECGSIEDHRFTCSEFVYYCYRSIHQYIGLLPQQHSLFGVSWLLPRETITPDDLYEISASSQTGESPENRLTVVWKNTTS
ncbi:MAG TPA: hypothetical protein DEQ20_11165 [Desulfobulbaceae bacterium]|nr:MAG: hypothetical protein A2520_02750 [Deltaproteobacteria bacterium RIFOXYD12_FULL_53_23]HCC55460.1 hypothetical protein [Desulfobulbaceae bacterium]